jgi:hypothetical protein
MANVLLAFALVVCVVIVGQPKSGSGGNALPLARDEGKKNLHSGVILRPEPRHYALLVPPLLSNARRAARQAQARPLSIPFSGEYWFFYSLFRWVNGDLVAMTQRPPDSSLLERGNPLTWTLTSMDARVPLVMKAHQPLERAVDLSCCARIDMAIGNSDAQTDSLSAELILLDSMSGPKARQSLGKVAIPQGSREAILRFKVPDGSIRHFDAIDVVIHPEEPRRNRSANLAIDRFDLIPF